MCLSPRFNKTLLATLLSFALSSPSYASFVRNDIDYQYFRDFAENKGKFVPNAQNIPIYNQGGRQVGIMMQNLRMPDFSAVNRDSGIATLVDPQYITSVKHNVGYREIEFGHSGNHSDAHHFSYRLVDRNNHATHDYHVPRLHKLVTETAPFLLSSVTERADGSIDYSPYLDKQRFPMFVRVGSGSQGIRDSQNNLTEIAGAYKYLTGGGAINISSSQTYPTVLFFSGSVFNSDYGPMATYAEAGDSGSPLFAFDKQQNKWVLAGTLSLVHGKSGWLNGYVTTQPHFITQSKQADEIHFTNRSPNAQFSWSATSGTSLITQTNGNQRITLEIPYSTHSSEDLARGKTLHISGQSGTLVLNSNIHQGAGALYFNQDFTVKAQSDQTWLGAGIAVAENKRVNWQVSNPKNDRLSKIGAGTLYVNGIGKNLGDISVGDGKVVLAQRADSQGQKQAFEQVGIVSGRATVVLNDADQVRSDNIYFGYRGGRLDLNGNKITFSRIQNVDDGANIVNHNLDQVASVTITGGKPISDERIEWVDWGKSPKTDLALYEYINPWRNNQKDYFKLNSGQSPHIYFPKYATSNTAWTYLGSDKAQAVQTILNEYTHRYQPNLLTEQDIEWGEWAKKPTQAVSLYEYVNPHRGNRVDYFLFKPEGNPSTFFPLDQNSNDSWEYIGSNREQAVEKVLKLANAKVRLSQPIDTAFNGFFGEKDPNKPNGPLNVTYDTDDNTIHLISGGTNLKGKFTVLGGTVLQSGRPVPQARKYENGQFKETFSRTDWLNRTFVATSTHLKNRAKLYIGRNVQQVTGNFHLQDNAHLQIGFVQGQTPVCVRYDYENRLTCQRRTQLPQNVLDSLPTTNINGDIYLLDNSRFTLGKAHYRSTIQARDTAEVSLMPNSRWTMWENSNLMHLSMDQARITLNPSFESATVQSNVDHYRTLTINGNLSGNGRFDFLTNLSENQADKVVVNGIATGHYQVGIKNTGAEPKVVRSPDLIELRYTNQDEHNITFSLDNGYVDLGAYRYILKNQQNRYHLYSPLREAQGDNTPDASVLQQAQTQLEQAKQKVIQLDNVTKQLQAEKQQSASALEQEKRANAKTTIIRLGGRFTVIKIHQTQQVYEAQQQFNQKSEALRIALANLAQAQNAAKLAQERLNNAQNQSLFSAQIREQAQQFCLSSGQSERVCQAITLASAEQSPEMQRLMEAQADVERLTKEQSEAKRELEEAEMTIVALTPTVAPAHTPSDTEETRTAQAATSEPMMTKLAQPQSLSQAEGISRYANLALSELTAQTNMLLRIGHQLDSHLLLHRETGANVWGHNEVQKSRFHSQNYRAFEQHSRLTQLGVSGAINDGLQLGVIVSQTRANNTFDQSSGRSDLTLLSSYLKTHLPSAIFSTLDVNIGRAYNRVDVEQARTHFQRSIYSVGFNLAKQWDIAGFRLQSSVGGRYHYLSGVNYAVDKAQVAIKSIALPSYHLGLKLDKTFTLGNFNVRPSIASYYVDANQKKLAASTVKVNQHALNQRLGKYISHELGLALHFNQWTVSSQLSYLKGNEIGKQTAASLKVSYQW